MKLAQAIEELNTAVDLLKSGPLPDLSIFQSEDSYDVWRDWIAGKQIPFAGDNGIYIYVSRKSDIWYVGKGQFQAGGGIGNRACSHLGRTQRTGDTIFPYHEWHDETPAPGGIPEQISKGEFSICTIKVHPDQYCSLVEVLLQSICSRIDGRLPLLNKRTG